MFKRLIGRKESSISGSVDSSQKVSEPLESKGLDPTVAMNEIGVQSEIPMKSVGTLTHNIGRVEMGTFTENVSGFETGVSPDVIPQYDQYIQCSPACMDAGVDPGDWNSSIFRGIECQTDCPDVSDPLLWLSGSFEDTKRAFGKLIDYLEQEELGTCTSSEKIEALKLRADNVLLRIELSTLKRKIEKFGSNPPLESVVYASDTRRMQRETLSALVGRSSMTTALIVTNESGVTVTMNLAPSSAPLGILRKGDKVLLSGKAEEISGLIRGPVLPRGWVTLSDGSNTYLQRAA